MQREADGRVRESKRRSTGSAQAAGHRHITCGRARYRGVCCRKGGSITERRAQRWHDRPGSVCKGGGVLVLVLLGAKVLRR